MISDLPNLVKIQNIEATMEAATIFLIRRMEQQVGLVKNKSDFYSGGQIYDLFSKGRLQKEGFLSPPLPT